MGRKMKIRLMILLFLIFSIVIFYNSRKSSSQRLGHTVQANTNALSIITYMAPDLMARWRAEVCHNTGGQCRGRRDGVEGGAGMGDRARLGAEQEEIRQELGL